MTTHIFDGSVFHCLSPDLARRAATALAHFLWEGVAIAAIASLAMSLSRRAKVRYAFGVVAMAAMAVAPIVTFLMLRRLETNPGSGLAASASIVALADPRGAFEWALVAWMVGVLVVGLRAAGGLVVLARLGRRPSRPVLESISVLCVEMKDALGVRRAVRFLDCDWLDSPAAVGWLRPVIYLPLTAISGLSESQLRAVIAHELAHVRRFDALVNPFQTVVEALLFYHPAVWWLSKRIRIERENCCDDVAAGATGDAIDYAHALVALEESRGVPLLALAATGGSLGSRIRRLLGEGSEHGASVRASAIASVLCLALACVAALCLLHVEVGAGWNVGLRGSVRVTAPALASTGSKSRALTTDNLVALRIHKIDVDYIDSLHALGYRPSVDELVSLRIHGVTPSFILDMRKAGITNASTEELIALRIHDVTPEYVADLRSRGLSGR